MKLRRLRIDRLAGIWIGGQLRFHSKGVQLSDRSASRCAHWVACIRRRTEEFPKRSR